MSPEVHVGARKGHDASGNGGKKDEQHERFIRIEVDDDKVIIFRIVIAGVDGPGSVISSVPSEILVKCFAFFLQSIDTPFNVDCQSGCVEYGDIMFIGNFGDELRIVPKVMIFVLHQTVISLAIVKVLWKPGAIDAVTADHAAGFRVEGHVGASHK